MNDKIWQKSDFGNISMTGDNTMRLGGWTQIGSFSSDIVTSYS